MHENDNYYLAQQQALAAQQQGYLGPDYYAGLQNMQYGVANSCGGFSPGSLQGAVGISVQGSTQGYQEYTKQVNQKEKGKLSMLKEFKSYVAEHKDLIFSVILLALADKVFLGGALQAKLASLIHRIVEGMEKKVAPTLNTEAK
jgi:hypothetical protein